jgi:hypothetical protein
MVQLGMDVDLVEDLGSALKADAGRLDQLTRQIDALVKRAPVIWEGPDARDFLGSRWPKHRQALLLSVDGVSGLGQSALNNAAEQRRASNSLGVGGGSTGSYSPRHSSQVGQTLDRFADLAKLSKATYHETSSPIPDGYTEVGPDELKRLGIDRRLFQDQTSGFEGTLYRDPSGGYVLAFRGSDAIESHPNDWEDNAESAMGVVTQQEKEALTLADAVHRAVGSQGATLAFTGVSLGGGLASIASVRTGDKAVTFNARGVSLASTYYAKTGTDLSIEGAALNLFSSVPLVGDSARITETIAKTLIAQLPAGQITAIFDANDPLSKLQDGNAGIGPLQTNMSLGDRVIIPSSNIIPYDPNAHDVRGIIGSLETAADVADKVASEL